MKILNVNILRRYSTKHGKFISIVFYGVIVAYLILRIYVYNDLPSIITDEIQYRDIIFKLKTADLFNPLYYKLYSIITFYPKTWYLAARIINSCLLCLGLIVIISICRLIKLHLYQEIFVVITALSCGISTYTINLMPDTLFAVLVWFSLLALLSMLNMKHIHGAILIGLFIGINSLVKPHILIFVPAFAATFGYVQCAKTCIDARKLFQSIMLLIISFVFCRWIIGFLMAGELSVGLFGGKYESMPIDISIQVINELITVFLRHVLSLALLAPGLFALTMIALKKLSQLITHYRNCKSLARRNYTSSLLPKHVKDQSLLGIRSNALALFSILSVISSVVAFSLFTASVATAFNEQITKIHLRYYLFLFPIIVLSLFALSNKALSSVQKRSSFQPLASRSKIYKIISFIFVIMLLYTLITSQTLVPLSAWVDAPPLAFLQFKPYSILCIFIPIVLLIKRPTLHSLAIYSSLLLLTSELAQFKISKQHMLINTNLQLALDKATVLASNKINRPQIPVYINSRYPLEQRLQMQRCISLHFFDISRPISDACAKRLPSSIEAFYTFDINSRSYTNIDFTNYSLVGSVKLLSPKYLLNDHALKRLYLWRLKTRLESQNKN